MQDDKPVRANGVPHVGYVPRGVEIADAQDGRPQSRFDLRNLPGEARRHVCVGLAWTRMIEGADEEHRRIARAEREHLLRQFAHAVWIRRGDRILFRKWMQRRPVDEGGAGHEDRTVEPGATNGFEDVVGSKGIDPERARGIAPGIPDVRDAGAVIDHRGSEHSDGLGHSVAIQKVHRRPQNGAMIGRTFTPAAVRPCRDARLVLEQMIDQVTSREAGTAGDQWRTRHGRLQGRDAPYCASW